MHINKITILVHDIDSAILFYRDALGLKLIENSLIPIQANCTSRHIRLKYGIQYCRPQTKR